MRTMPDARPGWWVGGCAGQGQGLHTLQIRILTRGVELATEGGIIVYSTCRWPLGPGCASMPPPV